jgi:hypothetical protein
MSAANANGLLILLVTAIKEADLRERYGNKSTTSDEDPLFENSNTTSFGPTQPKSPCNASDGCRKCDRVPVDENVAATFRPINPAFPIPQTINDPRIADIRSAANTNSSSIMWAICIKTETPCSTTETPRASRS